jgi:hypothetical protein
MARRSIILRLSSRLRLLAFFADRNGTTTFWEKSIKKFFSFFPNPFLARGADF